MTHIVNNVQKTLSSNVGMKPALERMARWKIQTRVNDIISD